MRCTVPVVVALLLASGCGGSSGSPTAPSAPSAPAISGAYSSSTFWSFRFANVATGQSITITCPGSATIQQSGSTFTGSFIMQSSADCDPSSGQIRSGSVASDGGVSFDIVIPGSDPNSLTALTGCSVISGDSLLRGSIRTGVLDASASAVLGCPGSANISLTMRWLGYR